jgi:NADH:ubiquinone oxidoreductase subunit 5 (subunit L)/multisubunit Na+/H+ antiporter MnhA subunit
VAAAGVTALCALALLPFAEEGAAFAVEWLPGTGLLGLTVSPSGLYAMLAITFGGFLVLLGTTSGSTDFRPLSGAVTLLALAAANTAFLTDHFLARYVALEIVVLCVALAPLIEVRGPAGTRMSWSSYLLLRVGDAGLLVGILILGAISGTLSIGPALGHALNSLKGTIAASSVAHLGWVMAGFVLAAWVKLGGWPFHLWSQSGLRLSLASHVWLYATVVPTLGTYLLFRVTPLLSLAGPLQGTALWIGAGGAALAALLALTRTNPRAALVYVGASQGGMALFSATAGLDPAVWVGLLVLTPLRLLLFLAADAAQNTEAILWRRVCACLFGLGGVALSAFGLLTIWWAREAGVPLDVLFIAQAAIALTAVWTVGTAWRLSRPLPGVGEEVGVHWTRWITIGLLGGAVVVGGLGFGPLVRHLVSTGRMMVPTLPSFTALLRYGATAPALLAVLVLSLAAWRLQRRLGQRRSVAAESVADAYDLEEGLIRAAQVLHSVVEVGIAERFVALAVRAVVNGARAAWTVEHKGLEGLTNRTARAVLDGALVAHRAVEQAGLEGLLRRGVRTVLMLSRVLQRWHTGQLRRNLLWVPIALTLAVLALAMLGR